jgi:hypothetical protein
MRPRRSLEQPANVDEVLGRLSLVAPDSRRQWGTMTPDEMLCHLGDSFEAVLGERRASSAETWFSRTVMKFVALHTSYPWPHGVPTRPEVDPKRAGTKPAEFERDRTRVVELLRRFIQPDARYARHPIFGAMSRGEWMLWGYAHLDHHLRQFGL